MNLIFIYNTNTDNNINSDNNYFNNNNDNNINTNYLNNKSSIISDNKKIIKFMKIIGIIIEKKIKTL